MKGASTAVTLFPPPPPPPPPSPPPRPAPPASGTITDRGTLTATGGAVAFSGACMLAEAEAGAGRDGAVRICCLESLMPGAGGRKARSNDTGRHREAVGDLSGMIGQAG